MAMALTGDTATQKEAFDVPVIAGGTFLGGTSVVRKRTRDHAHRSDSDRGWTDAWRLME